MRSLTVFYDETCAFCVRCRAWLARQRPSVPLSFVRKSAAAERSPEIAKLVAGSDLVLVADNGDAWLGDAAFLMILFVLPPYKSWARQLSKPGLRPYARAFFETLSTHRGVLSAFLSNPHPAASLREPPSIEPCASGSCGKAERL